MSDGTVTFLPAWVTVQARRGDTLLDAALEHGVPIEHECGGNCACTTCHVIVVAGMEYLSVIEEVETDRLSTAERVTPGSRLSCQALVRGGTVIVSVYEDGTKYDGVANLSLCAMLGESP